MQLSLNSVSTRMVKTNNYAGPLEYLPYIDRHSPDGIFVLTATDTMEDIISQVQNVSLKYTADNFIPNEYINFSVKKSAAKTYKSYNITIFTHFSQRFRSPHLNLIS